MNTNEIKWKKIETEELSIMVPKNFIGGNPKKDKKRIMEEINNLDERYRPSLKKFFSLPQFIFSAVDIIACNEKISKMVQNDGSDQLRRSL